MNSSKPEEKRRSARQWRSQPVWWKDSTDLQFQQGWQLECSEHGAAFLSRGRGTPLPGTTIKTTITDPLEACGGTEPALVRRVLAVHTDLFLVAAEYKPRIA